MNQMQSWGAEPAPQTPGASPEGSIDVFSKLMPGGSGGLAYTPAFAPPSLAS